VLHVTPESFVGGPLALVKDGDLIAMDIPNRKLDLLVDEAEMAKRRAAFKPRDAHYKRGFGTLYLKHVTQADKGCDFDFLEDAAPTPEPEIH
jgi:dihydroxyacid dehydratase/phosphogluconate dehydratase